MDQKEIDNEIKTIHRENAKSLVAKLLSGIFVLLLVGFIAFAILFGILLLLG